MLICKFERCIDTMLGVPLSFSVVCNNVSDVGAEFKIERCSDYNFYSVDESDFRLRNMQPPLMYVRDEISDLFSDICLREETEFDFIIDYPMSKKEILLRRKSDEIFPFRNRKLKNHLSFNNKDSWVEIGQNLTRISGRLNFKSYAGVVKFEFYEAIESIQVEVISYKLNYEDDFRLLLSELAQYHSELILSLDQPTEVSMALDHMSQSSPQVCIFQLRRLMERNNLPLAIETILANPHAKISHSIVTDEISLVANPNLFEIISNPFGLDWVERGNLSRRFKGYTPTSLPEEHIDYVFDTQENQYVKFCLEELESCILSLLDTLPTKFQNSKLFLEASIQTIEGYLHHPFFQHIGPFRRLSNSMVMQKRSGYKDLFRLMQEFEFGLQLESSVSEFDSINGDLRPIHKLYEYWCYFSLLGILQKLCGQVTSSNILSRSDKGYTLNLKEKSESKVSFVYNNAEVSLFYNRDFKKYDNEEWNGTYDGGLYHPDFSLQVVSRGRNHWIHFDAKYKLDYNKFLSMIREGDSKEADINDYSSTREGNYKRNDIYTVHTYRDAILGSRGAYILYPDSVETPSIFTRNPRKDYSFSLPSIGAFPLRTGDNNFNKKQKQNLEEHIEVILNLLTMEDAGYQEEIGIIELETNSAID